MSLSRTAILRASALFLLALAAAHPASAQTTITVGSLNSGYGGNVIPFGQNPSLIAYPEEYQQIYGAGAFSAPPCHHKRQLRLVFGVHPAFAAYRNL